MWKKEILIFFISNFKQSKKKISQFLRSCFPLAQVTSNFLVAWNCRFQTSICSSKESFISREFFSHPNSLMMNHQGGRTTPWLVWVYVKARFKWDTVIIIKIIGNIGMKQGKKFWKRQKYFLFEIIILIYCEPKIHYRK